MKKLITKEGMYREGKMGEKEEKLKYRILNVVIPVQLTS